MPKEKTQYRSPTEFCEELRIQPGDRVSVCGELFERDEKGVLWHACLPGRKWKDSDENYFLTLGLNDQTLVFRKGDKGWQ